MLPSSSGSRPSYFLPILSISSSKLDVPRKHSRRNPSGWKTGDARGVELHGGLGRVDLHAREVGTAWGSYESTLEPFIVGRDHRRKPAERASNDHRWRTSRPRPTLRLRSANPAIKIPFSDTHVGLPRGNDVIDFGTSRGTASPISSFAATQAGSPSPQVIREREEREQRDHPLSGLPFPAQRLPREQRRPEASPPSAANPRRLKW
nr:hypothetical protein Iba_chr02aCG14480 [Ipomoea batatas]